MTMYLAVVLISNFSYDIYMYVFTSSFNLIFTLVFCEEVSGVARGWVWGGGVQTPSIEKGVHFIA